MIQGDGSCSCKTCEYGRRISGLIERQATTQDQKLIRELYESFANATYYNALCAGRWKEVKPFLHLLRRDHFLVATSNVRLVGHERCEVCGMLEKIL